MKPLKLLFAIVTICSYSILNAQTVSLTTISSPENTGTTFGGGNYTYGAEVTITATPNAGYKFVSWTENGQLVSTDTSYTFVIKNNRAFMANFEEVAPPSYTLSSNDVTMQDGVITSCSYNFSNTNIIIPDTLCGQAVTGVDDKVFYSKRLTALQLPSSLERIDSYAFRNNNLSKVTIPSSVKYIGDYSFDRNNFSEVIIPSSVIYIGRRSFYSNDSLKNVQFEEPSNIQEIGAGAFDSKNDNLLNSIVLPKNNNNRFNCYYDDSQNIYAEGEIITNFYRSYYAKTGWDVTTSSNPYNAGTTNGGGNYATDTKVTITATPNAGYKFVSWTENGQLVSTDTSYTFAIENNRAFMANFEEVAPPSYTLSCNDVTMQDGVITSCSYSFSNKNIIIPDTLCGQIITGIDDKVFHSKNLTSVQLPSSLERIENYAFSSNNLSKIIIPSSVKYIKGRSFYRNDSLKSVQFEQPSNIQEIGDRAFYSYSSNLKSIVLPKNNNNDFSHYYDKYHQEVYAEGDTITDLNRAYYAKIGWKATTSANPSYGGITKGRGDYTSGTEVTITATPNAGYKFVSWTEDNQIVSTDTSYTFAIENDRAFMANFEEIATPPYTLSCNDVTMQDGVITECSYSFFSKNIIIPDTLCGQVVTGIGDYVFYSKHLSSIQLPSSLDSIARYAFRYNNFSKVNIPSSVKYIGDYSFDMNNFSEVIIPSSVIYIGRYSFYRNDSLKNVQFEEPSNIQVIGDRAFYSYSGNLKSIVLPKNDNKFFSHYYDNYHQEVYAEGDTITDLNRTYYAKIGWKATTSTNPSYGGITKGGGNYATGTEVTITATPYAGYKFVSWTENGQLISTDTSYTFTIENNRAFMANFEELPHTLSCNDVTMQDGVITECSYSFFSKNIIIPDTLCGQIITGIGTKVFNSKNLTSVQLPSSLERIDSYAFSWNNLSKITIPPSVKYIGDNSFDSNNLSKLIIPSSVTYIGRYSFYRSDSLKNVQFEQPSNIREIGDMAFGSYSGILKSIVLPKNNNKSFIHYYDNYHQEVYAEGDTITDFNRAYYAKTGWDVTTSSNPYNAGTTNGGDNYATGTEVTITATPNAGYKFVSWTENNQIVSTDTSYTFTIEKDRAFMANFEEVAPPSYTLSSNDVTMQDGVITSCSYNFSNTNIIIPDTLCGQVVSGIGASVFMYKNLTSVQLPLLLDSIAKFAFRNNSLSKVTIPSSVKYIGDYAFDRNNFSKVIIPSSVKYIGRCAFYMNDNLKNVQFEQPSNIQEIGRRAFFTKNDSLKSIVLPKNDNKFFSHYYDNYQDIYAENDMISDFDRTYYAKTGCKLYTVSSPDNAGTTYGGGNYATGTEVTVTAIPNTGYKFVSWIAEDQLISTDTSYTFVIENDRFFTAKFEEDACKPNWEVVTYTNSTIAYGVVTIGNADTPASPGDMVGAFVNGECRALAEVILEADKAYINLTINGESIEEVEFRVWDASECLVYDSVYFTMSAPGSSIGKPDHLPICANCGIEQNISMAKGWNLISLYVSPDDMDPASVFAPVSGLSMVKDMYTNYDPSMPFLKTLNNLKDGGAYFVNVDAGETFIAKGNPVNNTQTKVSLSKRWNLLGYPFQTPVAVSEALADLEKTGNLNLIKNMFENYDPTAPAYLNTLQTLKPGGGYLINVDNAVEFTYPESMQSSPTLKSATIARYPWETEFYTNSMVFYGDITLDGMPVSSNSVIGAFVEDECRGQYNAIQHEGNSYASLVIHGEESENVTFKLSKDGSTYTSEDLILLEPGKRSSALKSIRFFSEALNRQTIHEAEFEIYPNPTTGKITLNMNRDIEGMCDIYITDMSGSTFLVKQRIITLNGFNSIELDLNLASGVYNLQVVFKNGDIKNKRVVVK